MAKPLALRFLCIPRGRRKFSFGAFLRLLVFLGVLALAPPVFFHFRLKRTAYLQARKCGWLRNPPFVCAHGGDSSRAPPNTIKKLDASLGFSKNLPIQEVPTLEHVLKFVSNSIKQVIVDAKIGPPRFEEGLASDLFLIINKTQCRNCVIWAKMDNLVRDLKQLSKDVKVGYIVMKDPITGIQSDLLRMEGADVIGIYHGLVNEKLVIQAHRASKKVYAWTVDDTVSMQKMLFDGVDSIITSVPGLLQQVMEDIKRQCMEVGFLYN